jgi:hypothetical protein
MEDVKKVPIVAAPPPQKVNARNTSQYYELPDLRDNPAVYESRTYFSVPFTEHRFFQRLAISLNRGNSFLGSWALGYDGRIISPWTCGTTISAGDINKGFIAELSKSSPSPSLLRDYLPNETKKTLDLTLLEPTKPLHVVFEQREMISRTILNECMGIVLRVDYLNAHVDREVDGKRVCSLQKQ